MHDCRAVSAERCIGFVGIVDEGATGSLHLFCPEVRPACPHTRAGVDGDPRWRGVRAELRTATVVFSARVDGDPRWRAVRAELRTATVVFSARVDGVPRWRGVRAELRTVTVGNLAWIDDTGVGSCTNCES